MTNDSTQNPIDRLRPVASHNDRQSAFPVAASRASEFRLNPIDAAYIDWIRNLQSDGFSFFKFDITFSASGATRSARWTDFYNNRIVYKIQKVMKEKTQVISNIFEYEYDIKARSLRCIERRCPHHIHALIGIPSALTHRLTGARLKADLESLQEVSSVHITLIPPDSDAYGRSLEAAYYYMRKGKTHRAPGFE